MRTNGSQGYKQKQTNKKKFILMRKERQKSREEREEREIKYFYIIYWYNLYYLNEFYIKKNLNTK